VCTPLHQFYCSYSHGGILFRCLYTRASVFTVLIHMGVFYFAVCTPLHQFLLFLFTWAYFISLFVHPCISFYCSYSHGRIFFRCLYTPASVSTFLFTCTYFSALFVHPRASVSAVSLFTCTYLIFCSHSQYESESRYCRQATRYISVAATLFATCQALD